MSIVKIMFSEQNRLIAYSWSIVRNEHVAEDLFQDVSAVAIEKADEIHDADHLRLWARRALRFASLKHLRNQKRNPIALTDDVQDLLDTTWGETPDMRELIEKLRTCIDQLTPHAKQIVELRYVDGLRGTEVAKKLNRPPHTIYKSLSRIYEKLARCIRYESEGANA